MAEVLPGIYRRATQNGTRASGITIWHYMVERLSPGMVRITPWSERLGRRRKNEAVTTSARIPDDLAYVRPAPEYAPKTTGPKKDVRGQAPLFTSVKLPGQALVTPGPSGFRQASLAEVKRWIRSQGYTVRRAKDGAPHNGTATSKAAAQATEPRAGSRRAIALAHIRDAGAHGCTCEELEVLMKLGHQTVSPRIWELRNAGLVVDSTKTRKTRSGRAAIVWVGAPRG